MDEKRTMLESFNAAIEGIIYVLKTQKNMKFHFLAAIGILVASLFLNLTKIELVALVFAIAFVLTAEIFNTAIEYAVDLLSPEVKPSAKIVKDVSAAGVLLSAINAVVVGYLIFFTRLIPGFPSVVSRIKQAPVYLTFIALTLVLLFVLIAKAGVSRKMPVSILRGGMPSGHAALAFACWTVITFLSKDLLISTITFFLSFLISLSRIRQEVHNTIEVAAGALLGTIVTVLIFQLFS